VYILAQEGINAQMAVPPANLDDMLQACSSSLPFEPFGEQEKTNLGDIVPISIPTFGKLIVRTRDYVLRDGISSDIELDLKDAGPELDPKKWHEDLSSSSSSLLDCRKLYESVQGTFIIFTPLETDTSKIHGLSWMK
jgi:predicted sulfurtransferase